MDFTQPPLGASPNRGEQIEPLDLRVVKMDFTQPPLGASPNRGEQIEPLDLRVNFNCKSPVFHKQCHIFSQEKPLDLTVRRENIEPSYPSMGNDSMYSNALNEFTNIHYNDLTPCQQSTHSVLQVKELNSKFPLDEDIADVDNRSNNCSFTLFDLLGKNIKTEEVDKTSVRDKILQTVELQTVNKYPKTSDKSQFQPVIETMGDILLPFESNSLKTPSINDENHSTNNCNNISSTKCVWNVNKTNFKSKKTKNVSGRKVKKKSVVSMTVNQELGASQCEDVYNKNQNFEDKIHEESAQNIENNLSQNKGGEEPNLKKKRCEISAPPAQNQQKLRVEQLKKTRESFLQDGKCFEVAPKLPRCRECSSRLHDLIGKTQESDTNLCRFYAFRKLRYSIRGFLETAGFLDPHTDTAQEDLGLWQPVPDAPPPDLDPQMAKFVLTHVGHQFCTLCKQEEDAISIDVSKDKTIAWKRLVPGFREMCDVCNTTLFNYHWTCRTCGFDECIDCYKARKGCESPQLTVDKPWLICITKRPHDQEKMMLTQIIAGDCLKHLRQKAHQVRKSLGLPLNCCGGSLTGSETPSSSQSDNQLGEFSVKESSTSSKVFDKGRPIEEEEYEREKITHANSSNDTIPSYLPSTFIDRSISFEVKYKDCTTDTQRYKAEYLSSLTERLAKLSLASSSSPSSNENYIENKSEIDMLEEAILTVFERAAVEKLHTSRVPGQCHSDSQKLWGDTGAQKPLTPVRVMTLTESRDLYPDCPHSWLCEGRLLKLSDPSHPGNYVLFQDQWIRGQPVLVSGVLKSLDEKLWQPDSFIRDFGDTKNDLVNCMTGQVIPGQNMRMFWEGFQNVSKMLKDEEGNRMLLKLKDWPPGEDFAEMLPLRFKDLMKALPMGEYTKRTGQLNLTSRLPSCFARPDLGPKMYIAYGSSIYPTKGTTNLHLDMSDAVNVMVYAGIPEDIDREKFIKEAYRAVDEACSEMLVKRRVREASEVPGALWHIYSASDADKIRHLLTRVAGEQRIQLGPHQDPIHDQNWYLDSTLQDRLKNEYDVKGYTVVQCLGDAVFIPAGAPHQVRNLLNCIKVAEDFVSPENVAHCLHLTQEFRKLSDFHTNHEDKLQIKNMIFHAVKDSVSVLSC